MPRRASKTDKRPKAGKRYPLNMRTTFEIRRQLEEAAAASGRSLAQEAEARLHQSFAKETELARLIEAIFGGSEVLGLMKLISAAMQEAGQSAGFYSAGSIEGAAGWMNNPYAYDQATKACLRVVDAFRPSGRIEPPKRGERRLSDLGRGYANAILAQMLGNQSRTRFFTPERVLEVKRDLGKIASRLDRRTLEGEDLLFTAERSADTQAIVRLSNREPKEEDQS